MQIIIVLVGLFHCRRHRRKVFPITLTMPLKVAQLARTVWSWATGSLKQLNRIQPSFFFYLAIIKCGHNINMCTIKCLSCTQFSFNKLMDMRGSSALPEVQRFYSWSSWLCLSVNHLLRVLPNQETKPCGRAWWNSFLLTIKHSWINKNSISWKHIVRMLGTRKTSDRSTVNRWFWYMKSDLLRLEGYM